MAQSNDYKILERNKETGYGTKGTKIQLRANAYEVRVENPIQCIYHYDVDIRKWNDKKRKSKNKNKNKIEDNLIIRPISKSKKREIFERFCEEHELKTYNIGYDGEKSAYSLKQIKNIDATINIKPDNKFGVSSKEQSKNQDKRVHTSYHNFNVTFKHVSSVNFQDLLNLSKTFEAKNQTTSPLQAVNVLFHHFYAQTLTALSSDRFFSVDGDYGNETRSLGRGVMAVQGFFSNLSPHGWHGETLLMKLNVSFATFYEPLPVINFLKKKDIRFEDRGLPLKGMTLKKANRILKGLRIERSVWYKNFNGEKVSKIQTHTVLAITEKGANELEFSLGDSNEKVTVKDHIENLMGDKLKTPYLNCLHVDNPDRNIWIPMELCTIKKGQRAHIKVTSKECRELIEFASNKPKDLYKKIRNLRHEGKFDGTAFVNDMGLKISNEMIKFTGRVIPPPDLLMKKKYQENKDLSITPSKGSWRLFNAKVYSGVSIDKWILLNFDEDFNVDCFVKELRFQSRKLGVNIEEPMLKKYCESSNVDFSNFISPKPQLIFCVMYEKSGKIYGNIKMAGDIDTKILTQCLKTKIAEKAVQKIPVMQNIILQINAKLGGVNYIIDPILMAFAEPVIIMGADVNHPSGSHSGDFIPPSFAAVVASCDENATRYAGLRKAQEGRQEISNIKDLAQMTRELLRHYYKSTNSKKPKRIIMYRDGVSESQFLKLLSNEMVAIREACSKLEEGYKPGITFICVQKRNQTRFFLDDGKMEENVPPGTVDDKNVTHKNLMDFYLVSHAGVKGTSKPGHYVVLWDDNKLSMDELQSLTYNLCHLSPRTTKAISQPFPVRYAHEVAYRGHTLYKALTKSSDDSSSSSGCSDSVDLSNVDISSIEIKDTKSPMFGIMHCL